jgi:hypothetical protein
MTNPLSLEATSQRRNFPLGSAAPIDLMLRNRSTASVTVNGRLAVGYADGIQRELFFTVYDDSGRILPVADDARVDAHVLAPTRDDFITLDPGESVGTTVDASFWYAFQNPGRYTLVFTYDNEQPGAELGLEAWTGRVVAAPVVIDIG